MKILAAVVKESVKYIFLISLFLFVIYIYMKFSDVKNLCF